MGPGSRVRVAEYLGEWHSNVMGPRLRALLPAPLAIDGRERARIILGAAIGILFAGASGVLIARWLDLPVHTPWLVAPMGASAVLVFAIPASPMAQPWSVIAGNTFSTFVAVGVVHVVPQPILAAALAVAAAIATMFALRCLHPPGGAAALLVALGAQDDPAFAAFPLCANAVALALAGALYHRLTRRAPAMSAPATSATAHSLDDALDAVLARYNQLLDIGRDELRALVEDAQLDAYQRRLDDVRCEHIMARALVTTTRDAPLPDAWSLFASHHVKALPVVDAGGRLIGIVTQADFLRELEPTRLDARLQRRSDLAPSGEALRTRTVAEIMTRDVRVISADRHLIDLLPLFGGSGHHHIPVVDAERRLVGIVTQSDVVSALLRTARQRP